MQDFDPATLKEMANIRTVEDAEKFVNDIKDGEDKKIKNEYKALQEVEDLKKMVEKQSYLVHAFWLMLKEKGVTNEDLNKALNEAVLLEKRTDYKNISACPNCGKGLQAMENKPFTSKCYYCGIEILVNPYQKYDELDPYNTGYSDDGQPQPGPYVSDAEADAQEFKDAADVISQSFEPYDVSKDLNFDDENI